MIAPALIILAGGRSTRMGRPKRDLPVGDMTLLSWQVARFRRYSGEVIVVGALAPPGARSAMDLRDMSGPLAGIEAGLDALHDDQGAFVVACDMPRVTPLLGALLLSLRTGHDAVVPRTNGIAQPAAAWYASSALPKLTAFLDAGGRRLTLALDLLNVRYVDDDELRAAGHSAAEFADLDTPADYDAFLAEIRT